MTVFQRAAGFAVLSLCAIGLGSVSAPGRAVEATASSPGTATILPDFTSIPALLPDPAQPQPAIVAPVPVVSEPLTTDDNRADASDDAAAPVADALTEYASLAAAVAAQDTPEGVSDELRCLAGAVFYEAKGEPLAGQLAVAEVIINRAKSGRFPKSLCGVVTQRSQFSFVRGGQVPAVNPSRADYRTALAVAQVALNDSWDSPASNAMFFHARYVRPGWSKQRVASIGNHVFYR